MTGCDHGDVSAWRSSRRLLLIAGGLLGAGVILGLAPLYVDARAHWSLVRPSPFGYSCGSVFFGRQETIGPHTLSLVLGFHPCASVRGRMEIVTWGLIALGVILAVGSMPARRAETASQRDQSEDEVRVDLP